MMNDNHENDTRTEMETRTDGINTDPTWLLVIMFLVFLSTFPLPDGQKPRFTDLIKGAAKTIEDFEKAEEAKKDED